MPLDQVFFDSAFDAEIIDIALSPGGQRWTHVPQPPPVETVGRFQVRVADSDGQRGAASLLIERRYGWRGYQSSGLDVQQNPNVITLCADGPAGPLGTVTLGLDGGEGLLCEEAYPDEVAALRGPGVRLCELTKLAVDQTDLNRHIMAALFHIAYIYAHVINRATMLLIEVNPRHVAFYARALGFEVAGSERHCERAGAPAVLLMLSLERAREQMRQLEGGDGHWPSKSLYSYCFSSHEEDAIVRRIRGIRALTEASNDGA